MGPTPTPTRTLGMRLSCNFVNVYTIVYHVYTVHVHVVYARASLTDILARKSASRIKVHGQVGEEVGVGVGVGVWSVPWNLSFIHLYIRDF